MRFGWLLCGIIIGIVLGISGALLAVELFDEEDEGKEISQLDYDPAINPFDFVQGVNHTFFPLRIGMQWAYEGDTSEGKERIDVSVTNRTKTLMGVVCVVVRDVAKLDGVVIEDTFDYYAQDRFGTVWYFGEDTSTIEGGQVVSKEGSWEAGVNGAMPGIIMLSRPMSGLTYRQEFYADHAEDMGSVISTKASATVGTGTYNNCVQTYDWTPLEPDVKEYKYYASNVGQVLETDMEGSGRIALVSFSVT